MTQESHTVSIETALRIVADPCRRSILSRMIDSEESAVTVDTLVERISPENPPPATAATRADHRSIDVRHVHLPKLEAANLIEYDPRTGTIRYTPNERVERVLRFVTEDLE